MGSTDNVAPIDVANVEDAANAPIPDDPEDEDNPPAGDPPADEAPPAGEDGGAAIDVNPEPPPPDPPADADAEGAPAEGEPAPEENEDPDSKFKPKLYNFELYKYNELKTMLFTNTLADNLEIRCPEFAIILDHVIALLWLFYNDEKNWKQFTVPQIEWALKFIGGITSDRGQSFTDMVTIKKHLEQLLFETYSGTDVNLLDEKPPVEDVGVFGKINCPERNKTCTPLPETLKELLCRVPEMVEHLSIALDAEKSNTTQNEDDEIKRENGIQMAYAKLNNFEAKHLNRITEEIELFELIKAVKLDLGYTNGSVPPKNITNVRVKIEQLEQSMIAQAERT